MTNKISPLVAQKEYKKEQTICKYLKCQKKVLSCCSFATQFQDLDFEMCKEHRDWILFKTDMIKCLVENEQDWKLFHQEIRDFCGVIIKEKSVFLEYVQSTSFTSYKYYYYRYNGRDYKVANADELLYIWFFIGRIQYRQLIQEKSPYGEYQIDKYIANPDAIKKCVYYKNTWQAQDGHIYNLMITTIQNDLIDALKTNTLARITKEEANLEN
uniref:Uncharacterized protein n=1 Tax=viral metagenome TaxID=1070528 RepID=A0A6C0JRK3_9ZZZZ